MTPSEILTGVETHLATLGGWDTAPAAAWFPDFERTAITQEGLSAKVLLPELMLAKEARGQIRSNSPTVHVAIHAPIGGGAFADGAAVVNKAHDAARSLLNNSLEVAGKLLHGVEVEHKPTVDHDYAKQYNLWVSYLIVRFRVGG